MMWATVMSVLIRFADGFRRLGLYRILETAFGAVLASAGVLWLVIEISTYFNSGLQGALNPYWSVFFTVGGGYALIRIGILSWKSSPRRSVKCKIDGTDISLEIKVADVFDLPGAVIIPSSVTFDTSLADNVIHPKSIIGQFIKKYYSSDGHFDRDVQKALNGVDSIRTIASADKPLGKRKEYHVGTCIRVQVGEIAAYIVGIGKYSAQMTTSATLADLQNALPLLWEYIRTKGELESLRMPIVGSGRLRINAPRSTLLKEIIRSFVAATQDGPFCTGLTIAIHPSDFDNGHVDFEEIARFLECETCYRRLSAGGPLSSQSAPQTAVVSAPVSGTANDDEPVSTSPPSTDSGLPHE